MIDSNNIPEIVEDSTLRFSGAPWFNGVKEADIILAGIGGIGSYVAFLLARTGFNSLTVYDFDTIEKVNLAGQLFRKDQIGQKKTRAIYNITRDFCDNVGEISMHSTHFDKYSYNAPIMICGFDNMEARKVFFNSWLKYAEEFPNEPCLFIDGRLAAEEFQIICITSSDKEAIKIYKEKLLFSQEEAEPTVCSYKQTTFAANMIGCLIVNMYINFISSINGYYRELPFFTYYNATTVELSTINSNQYGK